MERKTIIKIMAALFVPVMIYTFFNLDIIISGFQTLNAMSVFIGVLLILFGLPFAFMIGKIIQAKWDIKAHGAITGTKTKKAQDMKKRIKIARECINQHRMTDPHMMANNGREMVIIRHEPSPSREDAIQWDLFTFTTTEEKSNWNPLLGIDGIAADKVFYVYVNSMTLEYYLMRFDNYDDASDFLMKLWQSGIMKVEASELDKALRASVIQGIGGEIGKKSVEEKKEEEKE